MDSRIPPEQVANALTDSEPAIVRAASIAEMIASHDLIRDLADSDDHVLPAHDPRLLDLYPAAAPGLEGQVLRLDLAPGAQR